MGCPCQGSSSVWTPPGADADRLPPPIQPRRGLQVWTTQIPEQPPAEQKP